MSLKFPGLGRTARSIRPVALLVAVTAAAFLDPQAARAQWDRPIDWLIPCTALIEAHFGANSLLCDDVHNEGRIKDTLDEASRLLESLGFESPATGADLDLSNHMSEASAAEQLRHQREPRCEDRYCAWLVYDLKKHGSYSSKGQSLVLDPFRHNDGNLEPGYDDGFGYAEVHELFHAVQFGYPRVEAADDDWVDWIIEGTAEHVMRAVGRPMGLSAGGSVWFRTYDQPLHVPPTEDDEDPAFVAWMYGSWEFFEFLGDYLGSDVGIQYLDHLFRTLDTNQNNGLEAVEASAHHEPGTGSWKGLYEAFPEFVAQRLSSPCYFTHLGTWKDGDCVQGEDNEHRFQLTFPDTVRHLEHQARDMSANGYLVRLEVPEGKKGLLTIRVPPDYDEEYLHLIVDDQRQDLPGTSGRRNEFTTGVSSGPHEFFVRVANVPWQISDADGGELHTAPIEFLLIEPYATITSISDSPGPSGKEIAQPLEVRFDRGLGGIVTDAPGPSSQYPFDPGLLQPCWLIWDHLHNAQQDPLRGDGLSLQMVHEGPIGPGNYPLADGARIDGMDPWPAGRPMVGFGLGFVNQPPAQQLQSFTGIAGTLTVESVVGDRFVTGTLHVTGENGRARDIARGWEEPPPNYLPGAVIRVEFGLLMRDPADPAEHGAVTRCLTPEPSGGGAGIAHGGDSADGADGAPEGRGGSPTDPEGAASDPRPVDPAGGAPGASDPNPGEQGADAAADPPADAPADPANSFAVAQEQLGPGEARWVSVQAQGRPDLSFSGSDVDASAGAFFSCFGPASSAHLGLTEGESAQDAELGLVVITATGIAAGATGTYAIDEVVYQAGGGALDWRGPVTLELSRHDASADPTARRVAGRILGLRVVDRETDALIPVEAEFDVNAACASPTDR